MPPADDAARHQSDSTWIFGYGSLIWRPDMPYQRAERAILPGYSRRFWQGSHDHRGTPDAPGRVVTLIPEAGAECVGRAYLLTADVVEETFAHLDHREKNGYERFSLPLRFDDDSEVTGLVYIGTQDNFAFFGAAPLTDIAAQIAVSSGPSGLNSDYLLELADALRQLDADDPHVFDLETRVRRLLDR